MSIRTEIKAALKEAEPNLGDGSISTYTSLLSSLAKKTDAETLDQLKNLKEQKVMEYIDNMTNMSSQKTVLSALLKITPNEVYQKRMIIYADKVNIQYRKQTMSENRKESYITFQEVNNKFAEIEAR